MAPSWATVFYWLAGFPHTYCLLPHKAWSKSTWTETITPSILTTPWWQANTLWSRHLFHLLFHCWKHFSYSVLRISESSCIVLCLLLIGGNVWEIWVWHTCGIWCLAKNAAQVGLSALVCVVVVNLPCTRLLFFGLCCELHHNDVLVFLNKYSALQFPCGACSWCTIPSWF